MEDLKRFEKNLKDNQQDIEIFCLKIFENVLFEYYILFRKLLQK